MKNFEVLIKNMDILKRIGQLANEIDERYKNEEVVLVCVLKGAILFFNELIKKIKNKNLKLDFIQVKSYQGTTSTGVISLIKDINQNIEGKHVILVEDIVDTGYTANFLYENILKRNPKSILMCSLLQKPSKLKVELKIPLLVGFKIGDLFIVGFGLDLDESYRTLKNILYFKR